MASAQRDGARAEVIGEQSLDDRAVVRKSTSAAAALEDRAEFLGRWTLGEHFVMNAPKKSLVDECRGPQVRREDEQDCKRQFELLAGLQREEVDAALERHDPTVEKLARLHALAAEVVD